VALLGDPLVPPEPATEPARVKGRNDLFARHGRALFEIAVVSALGILASAGFQVVTTRGLGPEAFGLLASFLAIMNVAAIGSAALRNSVAVNVAAAPTVPAPRARRFDGSLIEALSLGGACTVGILIASPWIASSVHSGILAPIIAAVVMVPYFLFARAVGFLQGRRNTRSVVWWTTGSQLAQFALAAVVLWMGFGVLGILAIHLVTIGGATLGSMRQTRKMAVSVASKPFSSTSSVVLALTIAFAWVTNVDVILVRSGAPELSVGAYAAAALLVKTTLILPATLSLYLLPRFVGSRKNASLSKLGVNLALAVTALGGLVILAVFVVAGRLVVTILFGEGYEGTVALLPWMALTWIPWAMTQAILVRITAFASKPGLAVLLVAAATQWIGATMVLPDVRAMITLNGVIGVATLFLLYAIHLRAARSDVVPATSPAAD